MKLSTTSPGGASNVGGVLTNGPTVQNVEAKALSADTTIELHSNQPVSTSLTAAPPIPVTFSPGDATTTSEPMAGLPPVSTPLVALPEARQQANGPKTVRHFLDDATLGCIDNYSKGNNVDLGDFRDITVIPFPTDHQTQPLTKMVKNKPVISVPQSWMDGTHDPKDVRDGLVYEIFNAPVIKKIVQAQTEYNRNDETPDELGNKCAKLEATTVFHSSQIYIAFENDDKPLSGAAQRQLAKAKDYAPNNTLAEYEQDMLTSPHQVGAENHLGMPSGKLYGFNTIGKTGSGNIEKKVQRWADNEFDNYGGRPGFKAKIYKHVNSWATQHVKVPAPTDDQGMLDRVQSFNKMLNGISDLYEADVIKDIEKDIEIKSGTPAPTKKACEALTSGLYSCPDYTKPENEKKS
jgi:hypothetical protein